MNLNPSLVFLNRSGGSANPVKVELLVLVHPDLRDALVVVLRDLEVSSPLVRAE